MLVADHNVPERDVAEDDRSEQSAPGSDAWLTELRAAVDEEWLPSASQMDRAACLPDGRLDVLADFGLFGMAAPTSLGGLGLDATSARMALRILSSACGATAFMFAQHQGAVAALSTTANGDLRDQWLGRLCNGVLAGTAYAHVRRAKQPVVGATPLDGGSWQLDGEAPWATSWGTAAVYSVAATSSDGQLLWCLLDAEGTAGLSCPDPLNLLVFGATGTVRMRFDGVVVGPENVLSVQPLGPWQERDRHLAARPSPLALGVGDRALALLQDASPEHAASLSMDWEHVTLAAEEASLAVDNRTSDLAAVAAARAAVVLGAQRLTTALLSIGGGRAAELDHPAQRLAREAMFYVVQAQNDDGRTAMLEALTSPRS